MLSLRDKIRVALQNARRAGDSYAVSRLEKALQPMGMAQPPNLREYVPTPSSVPQPQIDPRLSPLDQAEQLSMGLGTGLVNQFEGIKQLAKGAKQVVTDPVGSAKALYEGGREIVRNPALLGEMAQDIYGRATSGPMGFGEVVGEFISPARGRVPVMREIDVYHGSPHRFEEFDASKIGTGEGAQAYGHGIYLAESPDVAEGYRRDLSDKISVNDTVLVDKNRVIGSTGDEAIDDYLLAHRGNLDEAIKDLQKEINKAKADYPHAVPLFEEEMQKLKALRGRVKVEQGGSLYTADLPDEMVDRMLDWDKPLSEQSQAIQDLARKISADKAKGPTKAKLKAFVEGNENPEKGIVATGKDLYRALSDYGSESVEGSRALQAIGIPGIKYADAGSRGQGGGGTRNFVVFPGEEKKVKILKKDGQKLSAVDGNRFPVVKAGDVVDGLKVRPEAANVSSIKASLENYSVMPGIRSVSIDDFGEPGPLTGKVDKLDKRTRELADAISQSNEITPLIVVYSGSQNYILEGSHRIDALDALGKKKIPVIAVIDEDDPPAFWKGRR